MSQIKTQLFISLLILSFCTFTFELKIKNNNNHNNKLPSHHGILLTQMKVKLSSQTEQYSGMAPPSDSPTATPITATTTTTTFAPSPDATPTTTKDSTTTSDNSPFGKTKVHKSSTNDSSAFLIKSCNLYVFCFALIMLVI